MRFGERPRRGLDSQCADNLIWQTALESRGAGSHDAAIELDIANDIPIGKGLGSSAAAMTAGVVIANELASLGWEPHTNAA